MQAAVNGNSDKIHYYLKQIGTLDFYQLIQIYMFLSMHLKKGLSYDKEPVVLAVRKGQITISKLLDLVYANLFLKKKIMSIIFAKNIRYLTFNEIFN